MWSAVRRELFPAAAPRYSGSTSWRAIIPKDGFEDALVEYWGPSAEFGAMPVSGSELYWYGYFRHPAGAIFDDESAAARARFAGGDRGPAYGAENRDSLAPHRPHRGARSQLKAAGTCKLPPFPYRVPAEHST
jgi:hypothetical protein